MAQTKEEKKERARQYYLKNKDKIKARVAKRYEKKKDEINAYREKYRKANPEKEREWNRKMYQYRDPQLKLWRNARTRAKKHDVPFTITKEDIIIPKRCPVFDVKLTMADGKRSDTTASLDRINPKKGYVPGNIAVMSWRANRMKGAWNLEEFWAMLHWLEDIHGQF